MVQQFVNPPYPWRQGADPNVPDDWHVLISVVSNTYRVTIGASLMERVPPAYRRNLAAAQRVGERRLRRHRKRVQRDLDKTIELAKVTGDWREVPPAFRVVSPKEKNDV